MINSHLTLQKYAICACALFIAFYTHAQTIAPNAVVPDEIRPPQKSNSLDVPEQNTTPRDVPVGLENLEITLAGVSINNAAAKLEQATQDLIQHLSNQKVLVSKIYTEADQLEQAYTKAGYVLVRVVVPPQTLVDNGTLIINIVDGFIEEIDVTHLPEPAQAAVLKRTRHLIHHPQLTLDSLERALLLAGNIPGVHLNSTLIRGEQEGGAKLVLSCDCQRASISLGLDNRLDRSLDRWQAATVVSLNNLSGEQVYGMLGTGGDWGMAFTNDATVSLYGLGLITHIGSQGLTLNPEYTTSTVRPLSEPNILRTEGKFERYAVRLNYPAINTRNQQLNLKLGLEHIRQHTEAVDFKTNINRDSYDALRLGGDYQQRLYNQASMQISYSLSRGLGGRDSSDAQMSNVPLSRQEANPEFTKLAGSIRVSQPLYNDIRLEIIGLGQTAFNRALFRAEQFSLDGKDSLSPFPSGTLISDQGTTLRAEFSNRYTVNFGERHLLTTPYLFIAGGWGRNNAPTAAENETLHAHAWGLGVRNNMISRHKFPVSLGLEIGEGISSENNFKHLWRGMFSLFLSY